MQKGLTLYELNRLVTELVDTAMPDEYWVEAELSEAREVRGHCYMELVQKDELTNTPIAKASAKCWKNVWMLVSPHFERVTGQHLHPGMKVLLKVYATFHEAYGFSWIITDIDPTYTMGDMARKRLDIINRLKAEGVFDLQKELSVPMFARRIAVISSESAAGYGDFCNQLSDNAYGFKFTTHLFPAIMQGEQVEQSVIASLNRINEMLDDFDVVVIIRGGGATSDLSGFDTLSLAENVANFPLPIITGIGHDRDESILDMISKVRVKTPTAAAAFLIDNLTSVYDRITAAEETIIDIVMHRMEKEHMRLERLSEHIPILFSVVKTRLEAQLELLISSVSTKVQRRISQESHKIDNIAQAINPLVQRRLTAEQHRMEMLAQRAEAVNPERLLKRGYSITMHNGRAVRNSDELKSGDDIETRLAEGIIRSKVE